MTKLRHQPAHAPSARARALATGLLLAAAWWIVCGAALGTACGTASAAGDSALQPAGAPVPPATAGFASAMAVVDRIVDGVFVVFLIAPGETEWIARLPTAPAQTSKLPTLVSAEGVAPGTWGWLLPATESRPGTAGTLYVFLPDAAATQAARGRIAAKLAALRVLHSPPATLGASGVTSAPAGAGGPVSPLSVPSLAGWQCDRPPPLAAVPRPMPF